MKNIFLHILFLGLSFPIVAQQMQWASQVVDKSSQYGREYYSAQQALGIPNAIGNPNLQKNAWAPAKETSTLGEHIHVRYTVPMRIRQIVISESKNPGAIKRITLYDDKRKRHIIYQNDTPKPIGQNSRFFSHAFPLTEYKVSEVSVELNTAAVSGSNHIDAIGISPNEEKYQGVKVDEVVYEKGVSAAENLGIQINSSTAERLPIIAPDGKTLWFARKYHVDNRGDDAADDIWVSTLQGGNTWSRPINPGAPLNNELHNFVFSVNPAGDKLWLANEYNSVKKDGISYSIKNGRTWSRPRNVRIDDHYNKGPFVCYHISNDEKVLLMSVTRNEGLGENDLYVSFRQKNGDFSKPKSLGNTINTVGDDSSVFLAADGKTIYFSSDGHAGYGGYDMYRSQRLDDSWTRWSKPMNLGKKINTPENDYNYTIPAKGDYAYFSRDDASGMSDLFRIKLPKEVQPEPVILLKGQLLDANTKRPIGGVLKYEKVGKNPDKMISDDRGQFAMVLPYGENVDLYAEREGYFAVSEQIHLSNQIEELDADGGSESAPIVRGKSGDIDKMQLRLNELENDLVSLENKPSPRYDNLNIKTNTDERSRRRYASDPTLLALQKRYEARLQQLSNGNSKNNKEEFTEKSDVEEDELARMKRKFNQENGNTSPTTKKQERSPVISGKGDTTKTDEDSELAEMKAKFNRYNNNKTPTQSNSQSDSEIEAYFPWEVVEEKTRKEMEVQLLPEVREELHKELLAETKNELAQELAPNEQRTLQRIQPELKPTNYLTSRGGAATEDLPDWAQEIKKELRNALAYEVRLELKKELREEVKAELRTELEYQVKKELEGELRRELEKKIRAELLAEKNTPRESKPQSPATTPPSEEPAELAEPVYQELEKEILLAPIEVGQVIPMNNIFFASNEATLKEESYSELERVKKFLSEKSNVIIEIGGHTNGWCSHVFANELSTKRAKEVRNFLINEGIDAERIQFRGYGKTAPIASNDTKAGRRQNQRVEMKILGL